MDQGNKKSKWLLFAILGAVLFGSSGFFRVYYGGDIGFRVVAKHSISFTDSVVNLDNLLGRPRIVVASEHPAVKRQLEEMGIIESDQQVQRRAMKDVEENSKRMMRDIENETRRIQRELGY